VNLKAEIVEIIKLEAKRLVQVHTSTSDVTEWNYKEIAETLQNIYRDETMTLTSEDLEDSFGRDGIEEKVLDYLLKAYDIKEAMLVEPDMMRRVERGVYLRAIDVLWMEHLENMLYLRQGVSLRGYGQRDPLVEYKSEAFVYFEKMLRDIDKNVMQTLFKMDMMQFIPQEQVITLDGTDATEVVTNQAAIEENLTKEDMHVYDKNSVVMAGVQQKQVQVITAGSGGMSFKPTEKKEQGRNDECSCGSGKKFKKCCGKA
jgi:preprotein translocase subunit SecA